MPSTIAKRPITLKPVPARSHRCWWHKSAETLALIGGAIVCLEGFFAAFSVGEQEFFEPDPVLGARHIPGKKVTWRMEGFSSDRFNEHGMRDVPHAVAKPSATRRIAVLGDSAVEGLQVPLEDTFCRVLERLLNESSRNDGDGKTTEVLNFSCAGYGTAQQLVQYQRQIRKFDPDIVVLMYNRGDAIESVVDPRFPSSAEPRPYYYFDAEGKLSQDDSVLKANAAKLHEGPVMAFLRRYSRIYGVFSQANFNLTINEPKYYKLKRALEDLTRKGGAVPKPKYPLQDANKVARALIEELAREVKADGHRFMLAMFPNTVNDPELRQQTAVFQKMGQEQGFGFVDLTEDFTNQPNMLQTLFVKYHFSSEGHEVVARHLEQSIYRSYLQDR